MRIGIVTFFYANNYGGVLQAYSLQQFLLSRGHRVEFINYVPNVSTTLLGVVKSFVATEIFRHDFTVDANEGSERFRNVFSDFREMHLRLSKKVIRYSSLPRLCLGYDLVVTGSDQVWNTALNYSATKYFLLDFIKGKAVRRISYAPCVGQYKQLVKYEKKFSQSVRGFSAVSVRNKFSQDFIKSVSGLEPEVVCDPTLLVSHEELATKGRIIQGEYILVYCLNKSHIDFTNRVVEYVRERLNCPVVVLHSKYRLVISGDNIQVDFASPQDWLSYFRDSSFVITDSFHGMIFSLKYKRDFVAVHSGDWRSHRLIDTATRYGVLDKLVSPTQKVSDQLLAETDFSAVEEKINSHVETSIDFLKRAIED